MTEPLCKDLPELTQELVDEHVQREVLQPHEHAGKILSALGRRPENYLVHAVSEVVREAMDRLRSVYVIVGPGGIRSGLHVGQDAAQKAAGGAEAFVLLCGSGEQIAAAAKRYGTRFPGDRRRIEWLLRQAVTRKAMTVSEDRLKQLVDLAMSA